MAENLGDIVKEMLENESKEKINMKLDEIEYNSNDEDVKNKLNPNESDIADKNFEIEEIITITKNGDLNEVSTEIKSDWHEVGMANGVLNFAKIIDENILKESEARQYYYDLLMQDNEVNCLTNEERQKIANIIAEEDKHTKILFEILQRVTNIKPETD